MTSVQQRQKLLGLIAQACAGGARLGPATQMRSRYFYLYLFEDLLSRKIVGWQVFGCESAELAGQLLHDTCTRQGIAQGPLTVHSDNGAPMKGETMLTTMQRLGVVHTRN